MIKKNAIQVGDVFQVLTSRGVCYGQVINKDPKWKFIVAIFREFFSKEPKNFSELLNRKPQFITAFLIQDAVEQGLFTIVANAPVSDALSEFPTFRSTNNLKGDDTMWFFWKGGKQWKVHRPLTSEEKKFPKGPSLPSAPLLIEMIERNYSVARNYV